MIWHVPRYFPAPCLKKAKQRKESEPVKEPVKSRRVSLSHVILVGSGMVFMLLLQSFFWPGRGLLAQDRGAARRPAAEQPAAAANPPWGRLKYVPLALDRPEEYFQQDIGHAVKPVWIFRNHTEQQLQSLFEALDLAPSARAYLHDRAHWQFKPDAILVTPSAEVVTGLNTQTRRRLYALLGANPENVPQAMPFRFRKGGFDEWFAECGLPKTKIELAQSMTYTQENTLCFADAATFAELSTPDETKCLIRSLWRVPTFMMKLQIDPATDVDALLKYWGISGLARTYRPLIESMTRIPEGATLPVSYFLPPFARLRLYTYPPPNDPKLRNQDCFWTAMNFFNSTPDDRFFNPEHTQRTLRSDYNRITDGTRQFGDVLLLVGRNQQALHMCVYIADEAVFTKNGANPQQPWVLMKLPEMLSEYEGSKPFQIQVFRRKTPPVVGLTQELSSAPGPL